MAYKAIVLDLDGTVIFSEPGVLRCIRYALSELSVKEPEYTVLKSCIGPPLTESFHLRLGVAPKDCDKALQLFRQEYDTKGKYECELYPGIRELIAELKKQGYLLFLGSSKNQSACNSILSHFEIDQYFDGIYGSSEDAVRETKEEVLAYLLECESSLSVEDCLLVGDTKYDVLGAKAVSMDCLGVTYGFGSKEDLLSAGAVSTVDHALDVLKFLEES